MRGWLVVLLVLGCVTPVWPLSMGSGSGGGGYSSGIRITEIDLSPSGDAQEIRFSNGSVTSITGGVATVTTGAGGGGDFSSNTATSIDNELVLFSGTGGKTGKRATTSGVLFGTNGVVSAAIAGTHYVVPGGNVA